MPFCIQAGDVEGFDAFDGDGVGKFGDFFFGVHAFHGDPAAAVFQQMCRPVTKSASSAKARLVMTSARQSAAASTRPLMTRYVFKVRVR